MSLFPVAVEQLSFERRGYPLSSVFGCSLARVAVRDCIERLHDLSFYIVVVGPLRMFLFLFAILSLVET